MFMFTEAALGTLAGTEAGLALVCIGSDMEHSWAHGCCLVSRGEISQELQWHHLPESCSPRISMETVTSAVPKVFNPRNDRRDWKEPSPLSHPHPHHITSLLDMFFLWDTKPERGSSAQQNHLPSHKTLPLQVRNGTQDIYNGNSLGVLNLIKGMTDGQSG